MSATIKIVFAMVIWGSIGIFVRYIDFPAVEIVFFRALISGVLLLITRMILMKKKFTYPLKSIKFLIISGMLLSLNWLFLFQAYNYTTILNATLSYYMAPVFAVIFGVVLFKDKVTYKKVITVVIAVVGLILILSQRSTAAIDIESNIIGIGYGLVAAVMYAGIIIMNKMINDVDGLDKTLIQILTSLIVLIPIVAIRGALYMPSVNSIILILIIGVVHTYIPYILYFPSIHKVSIQKVAILSYIDPVSAVLFSYLFLSEPLGVYRIIGSFLILISTAFSDE